MCPACDEYASYCHLWPVRLCNISPRYITNGTILEKKKVTEYKMYILIFSTTFVWNIPHSKNNCETWSKMYIGLHVKLITASFSARSWRNLGSSGRCMKKHCNFVYVMMKIDWSVGIIICSYRRRVIYSSGGRGSLLLPGADRDGIRWPRGKLAPADWPDLHASHF